MRTLLPLLALVAFVVADEKRVLVPREVTVDAAFRYMGNLILISGDEYMAIAQDGIESYLKVRSGNTEVPASMPIQAAIHRPLKPIVYYYGNETSFSANQTSMTSTEKPYGKHRQFLQNGGPDAAAFKAGWYYIFKGCEYVKQKGTLLHLGEPQPITDIDEYLPCDIDAAWTSVDRQSMTILKGDLIWIWSGDGVWGPFPFESEYIIWSWQLKPIPDERFQLK